MFKTTSAVRTLIQISFYISKSLCFVAGTLDLANTERGYCNVTKGVLIPVGDYAMDIDDCVKINCEPERIIYQGCSPELPPFIFGMECELLRGGDYYPDCCPHIVSCRKIFDLPKPIPLLLDDGEDNFMHFPLTDQPVSIAQSEELPSEVKSNMSALPRPSFASNYSEENIANYSNNRHVSNATPYVEHAIEIKIKNANNFSDEHDFKSRSSLHQLISTSLPLSDTINRSENNFRHLPVTEQSSDDAPYLEKVVIDERNFSDKYDFKSRSPLHQLISTPLPLNNTINHSENNFRHLPVTEQSSDDAPYLKKVVIDERNFSDKYDFKSRSSLHQLISTSLPLSDTINHSEYISHQLPVTEQSSDDAPYKRVAIEVNRTQSKLLPLHSIATPLPLLLISNRSEKDSGNFPVAEQLWKTTTFDELLNQINKFSRS